MATLTVADTSLNAGPTKPASLSSLITVKAATTVTTTITDCATDWIPLLGRWSRGTVWLTLVKADATTIQVEICTSPDAATIIAKDDEKAAQSAGVAAVTPIVRQYTCANYSATDYIRIPLDLTDVPYLRVRAYKTGGAGSPTLAFSFTGGKGDA